MTPKPTYWTALNVEQGASKQKIVAAYRKLSQTMHPDKGGDAKLWMLITAAYNALKEDPQRTFGRNGDLAWQRDYMAATAKPKAEKTTNKWGIAPRGADEGAEDYRRRYAREAQKARYAADPEFAAKRKESSLRSHKKSAQAKKDAKKNAPAAA